MCAPWGQNYALVCLGNEALCLGYEEEEEDCN